METNGASKVLVLVLVLLVLAEIVARCVRPASSLAFDVLSAVHIGDPLFSKVPILKRPVV
jgi:hypothetical protein